MNRPHFPIVFSLMTFQSIIIILCHSLMRALEGRKEKFSVTSPSTNKSSFLVSLFARVRKTTKHPKRVHLKSLFAISAQAEKIRNFKLVMSGKFLPFFPQKPSYWRNDSFSFNELFSCYLRSVELNVSEMSSKSDSRLGTRTNLN